MRSLATLHSPTPLVLAMNYDRLQLSFVT